MVLIITGCIFMVAAIVMFPILIIYVWLREDVIFLDNLERQAKDLLEIKKERFRYNLFEAINQVVSLIGIAQNAKAGAVITIGDEFVVHIRGLYDWPDELFNKEVRVTGTLTYVKFIPDPIVDEDGAISTGAYGKDYVIENADYTLL